MNQTFNSSSGKIYVNNKGHKVPNYVLKQFNNDTGEFQNVVLHNGAQRSWTFLFGKEIDWPDGIVPVNEPRCGFSGDKEECTSRDRRPVIIVGSVLALYAVCSFVVSTAM
ncbi:hypothetical protein RvY_04348-2 [Ramazzottius varieornatus]|uniref:Receptor ligand binding region domain-containing protein n=1 Tax=Ramazzottius varieornatus TaxID=947166 RepID=A0A1D1URC4_RAMVA|nr:hypothetical protein RvY_04348-2 [Ramazzottius varieornatus]